jgi:myogenesis-regulating glycosidase
MKARYPIWSTWVRYGRPINESIVMDFAEEIIAHGFTKSNLDIDDFWEVCYGSLTMNENFSGMKALTDRLKTMGYRVTLWVHPFINKNCEPWYTEAMTKK